LGEVSVEVQPFACPSVSIWSRTRSALGRQPVPLPDHEGALESLTRLVGPARALEDRHGQVAPRHVALEQHLGVVGERRHQRRRDVGRGPRELDPERRPLAGRLDDDREGEPLLDLGKRLAGAELL